jgi:hypothetical protein
MELKTNQLYSEMQTENTKSKPLKSLFPYAKWSGARHVWMYHTMNLARRAWLRTYMGHNTHIHLRGPASMWVWELSFPPGLKVGSLYVSRLFRSNSEPASPGTLALFSSQPLPAWVTKHEHNEIIGWLAARGARRRSDRSLWGGWWRHHVPLIGMRAHRHVDTSFHSKCDAATVATTRVRTDGYSTRGRAAA